MRSSALVYTHKFTFYHIRRDLQKKIITQSWRRRSRTRRFPLHGTNKDLSLINTNVGTIHRNGRMCAQALAGTQGFHIGWYMCAQAGAAARSLVRSMGKQRLPSSGRNLDLSRTSSTSCERGAGTFQALSVLWRILSTGTTSLIISQTGVVVGLKLLQQCSVSVKWF